MSMYRNLMTFGCVAALALGLAACGGGGDDDTADAPTVTGPTQAELDAANAAAAAAAAKAAEEEAARMAAEEALAAEQAKQQRTTAKQLEAAINSAPTDGGTPPVTQSPLDKFTAIDAVTASLPTTPGMPAVPSLTGAGLTLGLEGATTADTDDARTPRMATGDSVGSLGDWAGTMYSHKSADTGTSNEAVVYINRADTPGKPFVEGVRLPTDTTLAPSTRTVTFPTAGLPATKDVAGEGFPTAGTTSYTVDPVTQSVVIAGTYQGASGQYSCDATCSAVASSAGVQLVGEWKFVADVGAMTAREDTNYLYFGWWITKNRAGDPTNAGAFTGVVGAVQGDDPTNNALATNPNALGGSATYSGAAAGKFAIDDPLGDAGSGHFTADVALKASFGSASTAGVTGTIDGFTLNDDHDVDWSVRLRRAGWDNTNAGAFAMGTNGTMWSIDGQTAPSTSGGWRGQMYDEKPGGPPAGDDSNVPTSATGTFHSQYGETHHMVGAFGVSRD